MFAHQSLVLIGFCIVCLIKEGQSLQIMLKTQNWYCFGFPADFKTILDIDYLITGISPEDVSFEAVQNGK